MESKDLLQPENSENQKIETTDSVSEVTPINAEEHVVDVTENETANEIVAETAPINEPSDTNIEEPEVLPTENVEEQPSETESQVVEAIDEVPEPVVEETAVVEEAPIAEEIPVVEETLIVEEVPVVEEVIVVEETTVEVITPAEPATPIAEEITETTSASDMISDIETAQEVEAAEEEDDEKESEDSAEKIEADYAGLDLQAAVETLAAVVAETDYNQIKQRVGILKSKILQLIKAYKQEQLAAFLQDGGNQEEYEAETSEWEKSFNNSLHKFKVNKNSFIEKLEADKQKNLEAKQAIIESLKTLVEEETNLKLLNDKFKECQEKWKEIGPVPQNESTNLWQNYHFYVEKFFDILRINKELRSLDLKKNLEQKLSLCETAESLLLKESINSSFKALQQLHDEWKEIGPVPEDKKEEIWERFKNASDQINARRREYYDSLFEEHQGNYNAKVVLCEQVDELITVETPSIKVYNEISDKLTEILKIWKTLGPAPAKLNDEIWNRFKASLDKFFQAKKEFFQTLKDAQQQNYNLKLNLAILAEGIVSRTDWKQATDELLALQKEWKEIGQIPRKHSEVIWRRFRSACDKFFEAKANYFSNIQEIEGENLKKKEELIQRIKEHQFGEDKDENFEIIKAYQREWTELGHVPKKDKDRIYQEYRDVVNKHFTDLKLSAGTGRRDNFKSRVDNILSNPNAERIIDKEVRFLSNKLTQLKEDITLWENNLGFFTNSKNADVLKAEFIKKIDSAKKEMQELEFKIRTMKTEAREKAKAEAEEKKAAEENTPETPETETTA